MPDIFNENGLQLKTNAELVTDLETSMKDIYGTDINLDPNSPDKQFIEIFTQAATDIRELLAQINSSFNPDRAIGIVLDERVVINNIIRKGGTYTIQPVDITFDRIVTLKGLDANFNSPTGEEFTVQDDAGTQFLLIDSYTSSGAETVQLSFKAADIGRVEVLSNTINTQTTIVLGVTNVNNSTGPTEFGEDQESDDNLKIRRAASTSNRSFGWVDAMKANLLSLEGVTDVSVFENRTDEVDSDGIPPHSMWAIVEGGANTEIANQIYANLNAGANMKGNISIDITTTSGGLFTAKFDRPIAKRLYIKFTIYKIDPLAVFDTLKIATDLANNLSYEIGDVAETSKITNAASAILIGGTPVDVQISRDGLSYVYTSISVDTRDEQWTVAASDITILGV